MNQKIPHKNMSHKRVRHKKITDRHNGKEQIYYEIRKVLSGTRSRLAFLLLAMILGITLYFAISVEYVNETGESERGPAAVCRLKRLSMGTLVLDEGLRPGGFRLLTEEEVMKIGGKP